MSNHGQEWGLIHNPEVDGEQAQASRADNNIYAMFLVFRNLDGKLFSYIPFQEKYHVHCIYVFTELILKTYIRNDHCI